MAFLTPDKTRIEHGLIVRERIVPDSARATRYVASYVPQGGKMKPCVKLSNGTGKVGGVTIHNTADIDEASATNDAEQYSRAYWPNCAMGGVAVHYYVDEVEAWQNLRDNEQGWHAADGNGPGNTTTIAIEIIMDGSGNAADIGAEKNGALLAALLLEKYGLGIDELYTHNHWMSLPDKIVYGKPKNCPIYILPHWDKFVARVKGYLTEFSGGGTAEPPAPELPTDIEPGSRVTIGKDALYGGLNDSRGKPVPPDQLAPKAHTVNKIGIHNHQSEALLQEIFSWVPTKHLAPVQTAVTPPQEDTKEYDELQQKYEDIWKRYDAKTLALQEIAGELQQCVDKIKKLTSDM